MSNIISKPVFKPEISLKVVEESLVEKSTVIHCMQLDSSLIRIWPTTYLIQENGAKKSLLHAFNISEYPYWKFMKAGQIFTLVFEGLDKSCQIFDLFEDIPESGGFNIRNIPRNKEDVYWLGIE